MIHKKNSFEIEESKNVPVKTSGIFLSKPLVALFVVVSIALCVGVPLIVYFTKSDVNIDKISADSQLSDQTWRTFCVKYGCSNDNSEKLMGKNSQKRISYLDFLIMMFLHF